MTTRVKIEIEQAHIPVVVEVVGSDGSILYTVSLQAVGSNTSEYIHSGQTLRVRERTTQEIPEESN